MLYALSMPNFPNARSQEKGIYQRPSCCPAVDAEVSTPGGIGTHSFHPTPFLVSVGRSDNVSKGARCSVPLNGDATIPMPRKLSVAMMLMELQHSIHACRISIKWTVMWRWREELAAAKKGVMWDTRK